MDLEFAADSEMVFTKRGIMSQECDFVRFGLDSVSELSVEAGLKLLDPELKVSRLLFVLNFLNHVFQNKALYLELRSIFRNNPYSKDSFLRYFSKSYCQHWEHTRNLDQQKATEFFKTLLEKELKRNNNKVICTLVKAFAEEMQMMELDVQVTLPSWFDPKFFLPTKIMN